MTFNQLYRHLFPIVMAHIDAESCGLLFGPYEGIRTTVTSLDVTGILPVKNISTTPADDFEFDHEVLREQWRLHRGHILGIYHSHLPGPGRGPAIASRADIEFVAQTGLISVIVAPTIEMRVYGRYQGQVIELASWKPPLFHEGGDL